MSKLTKKLTGILLVTLLLFSSVLNFNNVLAEEGDNSNDNGQPLEWEVVDNDADRAASKLNAVNDDSDEGAKKRGGKVRVSIVLDGNSTLDNGYSSADISLNPGAVAYRESLKTVQDSVTKTISNTVLDGEQLDVVWNLTLAANIISANVPYEKIEEIKQVNGVKDVVIENEYYPQEAETSDEPMMSTATDMVFSNYAWAQGYTGAGSLIAIVDTGLDIDHQSFNSYAFDMAIQDLESKTGREFDLLEEKDVRKLWSSLNAASRTTLSGDNAYQNSKVPYAYNYVDNDFDIIHVNDTQGEHGSHVASIAAGNKFIAIETDEGIVLKNALTSVRTQGNAPDAQLLVMKVFGKGGGAYESDYFAAIEDAIVLGADAVNLSLGSSSAGFSYNTTYQEIIDGLTNVNIIWANSAGNNGSWADQTPYGYLYSEGSNLQTGGSPATYATTLSTASVDNKGFTGGYLTFNDEFIFYTESSYTNDPISTIAGTYEFVYVDGAGTEAEFAQIAELLDGKIALCNRGSTSFFEKANAAVDNGAIATIIVNNQPGTINMNLTGYTHSEPVVSITLADGTMIKDGSESAETEEGLTYYTGTIIVGDGVGTKVDDNEYYTMSSFSSYGVPGSLTMKPEITTPGGNIYAAFGLNKSTTGEITGGHDQYENMSGTSMASPQTAGIVALMAQYVKETGLDKKAAEFGVSRRALIQSLLMSTSVPLVEEDSGEYYSVLKQGSGLADVNKAMNSNVFIMMDDTTVNGNNRKDISQYAADGKVKAELGDDPDRSGKYSVRFTMNNLSDTDAYFDLNADMFTQDVFEEQGMEFMGTWTTGLDMTKVSWYMNGFLMMDDVPYDFNQDGDGVYDHKDAVAILDYVVGNRETLGDIDAADMDGDGSITTYDAYLALKLANQASAIVPANGSTTIEAKIEIDPEEIAPFDNNGAWIEGFLSINEKESEDGEIGILHTIPVLGYYGSWAEPSSIDVGTNITLNYELEDRSPYMSVSSALGNQVYSSRAQTFIGKHGTLGVNYMLGANPLGPDFEGGVYYPERNAFNSSGTLVGAQYSLTRNTSAVKYEVTADGKDVADSEIISNQYAAYYYPSQAVWRNTYTSSSFNKKLDTLSEGQSVDLTLSMLPEYYVNNGEAEWNDNIEPEMALNFTIDNTAPKFDSVFGKRLISENTVVDEEGNKTVETTNDIVVTISASDNGYIAGAFLYDETDTHNALDYRPARDTAKKGALDSQDYVFILSGEEVSDHIYVEVWDYAANITTVQVNLNKDELEEESSVTLDYDEYSTVVNSSFTLMATVGPWGAKDQDVVWTSDNELAATVNDNGVVTGVGEGSAVIKAALASNPNVFDTCVVDVVLIDRELKGFVWDENGEVWLSQFNTATLPNYNKLSGSLRLPLVSTAYGVDGTLYAASFDSEEQTSSLYTIDENTYEVTEVGASNIGYMDIAPAPNLGPNILVGVYYHYVVMIDTDTGGYLGGFDLSKRITGDLVGIAYEEYSGGYDWYFLIDDSGKLYGIGIPSNGQARFYSSIDTGFKADVPYFQSLYYDGTDLYYSNFSNGEGKVYIRFITDIYNDPSIYNLGSFDAGVWPVGGLYNDNERDLMGLESIGHDKDAISYETVLLEKEITPLPVTSSSAKGTTDSVITTVEKEDVKPRVDYDDEDEDVVSVALKNDAEVEVTNGLYTVKYDPAILSFSHVDTKLSYKVVNCDQNGTVTFAFADLTGVAPDAVIASVVFDRVIMRKTSVSVLEAESNQFFNYDGEPEVIVVKDPTEDFGDILPEDRPEFEEDIPEGIWLSALTDLEYTGKALTQEFRVYNYKTLLTAGTDYTVSYKNNVKAGTATVTVTGKGNYKDKVEKTFEILPAEISYENTVIILNKDAFLFNNKVQKPTVSSVEYNGVKLKNKTDYTVTYETPDSKEEGLYFIEVKGVGNYAGEVYTIYIISSNFKPVNTLGVSGIKNMPYTGEEITQNIVVKDGRTVLVEGEDYYVGYTNNVEVGKAYVYISGTGNYGGTMIKSFNITPVTLKANNTTVVGLPTSIKYAVGYVPETVLLYNGETLVEGEDYTVSLKNIDKVGTATVTFKGVGNYNGSFSKTYKITAIDMNDIRIADVPEQAYQKGGSRPDVEAYDTFNNVKLVLNKDYTLSYANNNKPGTATVTFKGKGNYTGTAKLTFLIRTADLGDLTASAPDKAFVNRKNAFKSTLTITDVNGKKLAAGTDYDKNVVYTYTNNTDVIDTAAKGEHVTRQAGSEVLTTDIIPADTEITVTATAKGNNYTGTVSTTYRIVRTDIASAKVTVPSQIYTGKPIQLDKADITVKLNKTVLSPEDFEIVSYENNVNKGIAKVTIKGVGNYGGTKTSNFNIVQKSFINALWLLFN